jgi:hypothetical protein
MTHTTNLDARSSGQRFVRRMTRGLAVCGAASAAFLAGAIGLKAHTVATTAAGTASSGSTKPSVASTAVTSAAQQKAASAATKAAAAKTASAAPTVTIAPAVSQSGGS